MIIDKIFKETITKFQLFINGISFVMLIIAAACILVGIYLMFKKKQMGKWVSLTGCLLLINPIIYYLMN